jgi:hypothetical protein
VWYKIKNSNAKSKTQEQEEDCEKCILLLYVSF